MRIPSQFISSGLAELLLGSMPDNFAFEFMTKLLLGNISRNMTSLDLSNLKYGFIINPYYFKLYKTLKTKCLHYI